MTHIIKNKLSRVFISDHQNHSWQLFNLGQKKEGSIYLSSPDFKEFEFLSFQFKDGKIHPFKLKLDVDGHLSLHASGNAHLQTNNKSTFYQLPIAGQYLYQSKNNSVSLRHLFTIFSKKPNHVPCSAPLNRKSDQILKSSKPLTPFVAMIFALPRHLNVRLKFAHNIKNFELLGVEKFPLLSHSILMIFYKTNNMNNWPQKTMVQYWDGINVPIFKGMSDQIIQVDFKQPVYELNDTDLIINFDLFE